VRSGTQKIIPRVVLTHSTLAISANIDIAHNLVKQASEPRVAWVFLDLRVPRDLHRNRVELERRLARHEFSAPLASEGKARRKRDDAIGARCEGNVHHAAIRERSWRDKNVLSVCKTPDREGALQQRMTRSKNADVLLLKERFGEKSRRANRRDEEAALILARGP
jgi:hypothetical protein